MTTNPNLSGYGYSPCRLLGHSWHHVPSDWKPQFGEPMTVRCERCDMERRDTVQRGTGEVLARRYTYPIGYQFVADERPTRDQFRASWLDEELAKARQARRERSAGAS